VTQRAANRYALVYRSIDHQFLKNLCAETSKAAPPARYARYFPSGGFDQNLQSFAAAVIELHEKRNAADYNPQPRFRTSDANLAIGTARSATRRFLAASDDDRKAFLTLLVCPPR